LAEVQIDLKIITKLFTTFPNRLQRQTTVTVAVIFSQVAQSRAVYDQDFGPHWYDPYRNNQPFLLTLQDVPAFRASPF
jgi:hypothetical protein